MFFRVKKSKFKAGLINSRGQALIEYVLLLVITVSLILALMNVMFKPFGEFIDNYMGKYVACLLEYGELPTLGGDTPSPVSEDSECNKKFEAGSLAAGRPPKDGAGGSSSSNGQQGNNGSGNSGSSDSSGGSGGSYAGSDSRGGGRFIDSRRGRSMGVESGGDAGGGRVVESAFGGSQSGQFFASNTSYSVATQGRKVSSVPLSGLSEADKKKIQKKKEGNAQVIASGGDLGQTVKKIPVKPPPQKTELEEAPPMTIGNFIRYLFIAALVIALVIFIGGQALQMSKSGEK